MMKEDVFESKYLKGEDIGDSDVKVIIAKIEAEVLKEGEKPKPVAYFKGKTKGMVINSGNWDALEYAYGPESDDWIGQPATIFTIMGTFQGVTKPWLRIKAPRKGNAKKAPPVIESENPGDGMTNYGAEIDDEIPF